MVKPFNVIQANRRSYVVTDCLGRGGFGAVYRATMKTNAGFQMDVALKFLNDHHNADPAVRGRLRDEARIVGLLRHRAIVKVHHLGVIQRRWSVVMEYLPGLSAEALAEDDRLCSRHAVEIVAEVAAALDHAWTAPGPEGRPLRVMHRDIKPGNILVTEHGEVKVLDFGIARAELATRESETRDGAFGTLSYMAPERFLMRQDASTDVYSLGATLYELLSGEPLGEAKHNARAHNAFIEERIAALPERPDGLVELLVGSLIFSPEQRLDASGFADLCQVLLASEWFGEPPLKEWGQQAIPRLMKQRRAVRGDDPLLGAELFEEDEASTNDPPPTIALPAPPSVHPRRSANAGATTPLGSSSHISGLRPSTEAIQRAAEVSGRFAVRSAAVWALGISLCGAAALGAAGAGLFERAPQPVDAASALVGVASTDLPSAAIAGRATVYDDEAAPPAPPTVEMPMPAMDAQAKRAEQLPVPSKGRDGVYVSLTGDVERLTLRGERGEFTVPGRVPPGVYTLHVPTPGWEQPTDTITVHADRALTLVCRSRFASCAAR